MFGSRDSTRSCNVRSRDSPTLDEARARLAQAKELRAARAGRTRIRSVDLTAGAERQRIDPATFGFPEAPNPGPFQRVQPRL